MLTLKHLELFTRGCPLHRFRLCYHKAQNRKRGKKGSCVWGEINVSWEQAWLDSVSSRTWESLILLQHLAEAGQAERTSRHPTVLRLPSNFSTADRHHLVPFHPHCHWSSSTLTLWVCVCLFSVSSFWLIMRNKLDSILPKSTALFNHWMKITMKIFVYICIYGNPAVLPCPNLYIKLRCAQAVQLWHGQPARQYKFNLILNKWKGNRQEFINAIVLILI